MFQNCASRVVLIIIIVSFSANSSSATDIIATKPRPLMSNFHATRVVNETIRNTEKNVEFDVNLFDKSLPIHSELKKKRQASSDSRNDYRDRPRPDQRSLLIVFDATGSMHDDLEQLRAGAKEIVNELSVREDNPIFNYVLVVYRDPTVESPFDTKNADLLLERLNLIRIEGGGDCPEYALSGLKLALESALPNSLAYVFSDATAKDLGHYEEVYGFIQKKQVTVNFLLTGNCHDSSAPGYQVYLKLSQASNGQVYDMKKTNVKDVLLALRHSLNYNYAALKTVVADAGTTNTKLNVDKSISELSVSLSGKNAQLTIKDPQNETIKAGDELTLQNVKLVKIKNPADGSWDFESTAESSHTILFGAISDLKFNFGFSVVEVKKISETSFQPLRGHQNILSIFVSDPKLVKQLSEVTIFLIPIHAHESSDHFKLPLRNVDDYIYATDPFDIPSQMFKIQLNGIDSNGNLIERLISTGLHSSDGSAPDISIEVNQKEINEHEKLSLKCIVKSHTPVNISWIFEGQTVAQLYSNQNNVLEFTKRVSAASAGKYFCDSINSFGGARKDISIRVLSVPKVLLFPSKLTVAEGFFVELQCIIEKNSREEDEDEISKIMWFDDRGRKLETKTFDVFEFIATREYHNKTITCSVQHGDSFVSNSSLILVEYPPKLEKNVSKVIRVTHGGSVELSCETDSNPKTETVKWFFTPKNSLEKSKLNETDSRFKIHSMSLSREGTYECIVKNIIGTASREFEVSDYPKGSPKIQIERDIIIVNETDSIDLVCESLDSLPMTNFSWMNENSNNYERFVIQDEVNDVFKNILRIGNIDESDNGSFECYLANEIGQHKISFELLVQTAAKIDSIKLSRFEASKKTKESEKEIENEAAVLENDEVVIDCIVDGFPAPEVKWFKEQNEIKSIDGTLVFKKVLEGDSGNYHCLALNILAIQTKSFFLNVQTPPKTKEPKHSTIKVFEDERVELNCNVEGNPRPKLSWSANDKPINERMKLSEDNQILSFEAQLTDSGMISCFASNQFGVITRNFTVLVFGTPKILLPNDEQRKSTVGDRLVLSCGATGFPHPQIKWKKEQHQVGNNSELIFDRTTLSDAGVYVCDASNEVGSSQKVFYVTVVEPPSIKLELVNITLSNNQTEIVLCEATGTPDPIVFWSFKGEKILSGGEIKFNASMQTGLYACMAENSEGKDEETLFFSAINKPALIANHEELKQIKLREGDGLELLCPFDNFDSVSWKLNNLTVDGLNFVQSGNKLTIHKVDRLSNGEWKCDVENSAGNDSFSFNVTVLAGPVIHASWNLNNRVSEFLVTESDIDEKTFKVGESLNLNCTAQGFPKPKVVWRKASDVIAEGENLLIDNLEFHHSDIYTCSAENGQGVVKKFFKIDVVSQPVIEETNLQKNFQMAIGDSLTLKCKISGNPVPNIFWFKDNVLLDDETDSLLELEKLSLENDGTYKCIAKNEWGREDLVFNVSVMESANVLQAVEEQNLPRNENSMKLSCTVRGNPLPVVSWISNGHILSTTSKLNLEKLFATVDDSTIFFNGFGNTITYLNPFMLKKSKEKFYSQLTKVNEKSLKFDVLFKDRDKFAGNYQCYAFNALGADKRNVEVKIYQKPSVNEKQMKSLDEIEVLEGLPLLLTCLMSGLPTPEISWFKGTTQLHENETIKIHNENRFLSLSETFLWNSGNYSCKAVNSVGEKSLDFHVSILVPPRFVDYSVNFSPKSNHFHNDKIKIDQKISDQKELRVMKGDEVSLECFAEGSPHPAVHWLKLDFYDRSRNEILDENDNVLIIRSIQDSSDVMCYINNTVGSIQKIFHIVVQFSPKFIANDKLEHHHSIKMHHGVNFDCKVDSSPESKIKWFYNSSEIDTDDKNFYFSDDNQVLRIIEAVKSGKFLCVAENSFGKIERVFYLNVEVPIQWSSYGPWTACSVTCGKGGIQYRTRICILSNGHPATADDYKCVGENVETRKCNRLQCPINGGWGSFGAWSKCPRCADEKTQELPIISQRSRECNNPPPSNGGLDCVGLGTEEFECQIDYCPVNGGWSEWSSWSGCSKSCGASHRMRKRLCNNPVPKSNGTYCEGENVEYEECKTSACVNVNRGFKKSFNTHHEDELEELSNKSNEKYGEAAEFELQDLNGVTRSFQFIKHSEVQVSPPTNNEIGSKIPKIKITLDTFKPISEETYNHHVSKVESKDLVFDTSSTSSSSLESIELGPLRSNKPKTCMRGFFFNSIDNQCEDVNECQTSNLHNCTADQKCINLPGSFRCEKKARSKKIS